LFHKKEGCGGKKLIASYVFAGANKLNKPGERLKPQPDTGSSV
jgi:hypothetical protein